MRLLSVVKGTMCFYALVYSEIVAVIFIRRHHRWHEMTSTIRVFFFSFYIFFSSGFLVLFHFTFLPVSPFRMLSPPCSPWWWTMLFLSGLHAPLCLRVYVISFFVMSCFLVPHASPFEFEFDVDFLILFFSLVLRPCPRFLLRVIQRGIRIWYVRKLISLYILVWGIWLFQLPCVRT